MVASRSRGRPQPSVLDVEQRVAQIVSDFGRSVAPRLRGRVGSAEDHLRGPVVTLLESAGRIFGLDVVAFGEARLPELSIRPDYLIEAGKAQVGYVELKAPGRGVPGHWLRRPSAHDRRQWDKLQVLPNLLYTDGTHWALYRSGELQGEIAILDGKLSGASEALRPMDTRFSTIVSDFLRWEPQVPRTIGQLVNVVAGLCDLLRAEVIESINRERSGFSMTRAYTDLAEDWRELLFPDMKDDKKFADHFAQTLTFALLLARVEGISFSGRSVPQIARLLTHKHTLMGRALEVLTASTEETRSIAVETLRRVIAVVDWQKLQGKPDETYPYLYERFLEAYDPELRRESGSYFTPPQVVAFMVRFVDDLLQSRLDRPRGFSTADVVTVDPAMGTGTFLEQVVRTVAHEVSEEEGPGQVPPRLRSLIKRLIGFENQAAPFAVAELRLHRTLRVDFNTQVPAREFRFLADTLADPDPKQLSVGSLYRAIRENRDEADRVKREVPVMVVIGNPPFRDKSGGRGSWIESGSPQAGIPSPLDAFRSEDSGKYEYLLSSMAVYFWRWATWKVFDAHSGSQKGVVAFISPSAFLDSKGFAGMREYLRRNTDEGWILDVTPEGHRADQRTRIFRDVQQPLYIGIFVRHRATERRDLARVWHRSVTGSRREKLADLETIAPDDSRWSVCKQGPGDPFRPPVTGPLSPYPSLDDLMPWSSRGVTAGRTWVTAPDKETLEKRWAAFLRASPEKRGELLPNVRDRSVDIKLSPLPGVVNRSSTLAEERLDMVPPETYGYRAFDRQYIIPDNRLLTVPRSALWQVRSSHQIFLSEQDTQPLRGGPGLLLESRLPDLHHFMGHHGGRVRPLYRDGEGEEPNLTPGLLRFLSARLGVPVAAEDFAAFVAAVVCHPGYTALRATVPGGSSTRVPLVDDPVLWSTAVELGREVIWLHTFGERCVDKAAGRPASVPRLDRQRKPLVRVAVPDTQDSLPDQMWFEPLTETLCVGAGRISPVAVEIWSYHVSGMGVLKKWFEHRGRVSPRRPRNSALDKERPDRWTDETTGSLLDLLNVLGRCVLLEPAQDNLLKSILAAPTITGKQLAEAGILPAPKESRKPRKRYNLPGQRRIPATDAV